MRFNTIKFRLNIWYTVVFVVVFAVVSSGIYIFFDRVLHHMIDEELKRELGEIKKDIDVINGKIVLVDSVEFNEPEHLVKDINKAVFFRVFDSSGSAVMVSKNFDVVGLDKVFVHSIKKDTIGEFKIKGHRLRVLFSPVVKSGKIYGWVEVLMFEGIVEVIMKLMRVVFLVSIVLASVIAMQGGNIILSKVLKPLNKVIKKANKITVENLSERIELKKGEATDEMVLLVKTLNELFSRLELSFKRMLQFTSNVSHQLLTPLTIAKDEIEVALMKKRKTAEYIETLNIIHRQIDRSISLVKSMLELARADSSLTKLNITRVELGEILKDIALIFSKEVEKKRIDFNLKIPGEIWINSDSRLLFESLKNIVSNAVNYTGVEGKITLKCWKENEKVKIEVSDTGIGIPADELPYIFDRFYRGNYAFELNPGGSGLGLSLAKAFVELMGGKIEVKSKFGEGTTFLITLPAS